MLAIILLLVFLILGVLFWLSTMSSVFKDPKSKSKSDKGNWYD